MNFRDDEFSLPSLSGVAERLSHPSNPRSAASHPTNTPVRAVPLPGLAHQSVVATPSPVSHVPVLGIPPMESAIDGPATVRTLLSARRRSSPRIVPVVAQGSPRDAAVRTVDLPGVVPSPPRDDSIQSTPEVPMVPPAHTATAAATPPSRREVLCRELASLRVRELCARATEAGLNIRGITDRSELVAMLLDHELSPGHAVVPLPAVTSHAHTASPASQGHPTVARDSPPALETFTFPAYRSSFPIDGAPASSEHSLRFRMHMDAARAFEDRVAAAAAASQHRPSEPGVLLGFDEDGGVQLQFPSALQNLAALLGNLRDGDAAAAHPDSDDNDNRSTGDMVTMLTRLRDALAGLVASSTGDDAAADVDFTRGDADSAINSLAIVPATPRSLSFTRATQQLCSACSSGNAAGVRSVLAEALTMLPHYNNTVITFDGNHPLYLACVGGHCDAISALLSGGLVDGVHVQAGRKSALYAACERGHVHVLNTLLPHALPSTLNDRCAEGHTPLWIAAAGGHVDVVEVLLSSGVDVDAACSGTLTSPLWQACARNHARVATLLLQHAANINLSRSSDGVSPLWIACANNSAHCVQVLLSHAASLAVHTPATESQLSPLDVACQLGHNAIVRMLLASQGSLRSSVHPAMHGNPHLVKMLLT